MALNWLLRRPTVATIVIGARNKAQLKDNIDAAAFTLTQEQVKRLDEASARPKIYPYWNQERTYSERNPPLFP